MSVYRRQNGGVASAPRKTSHEVCARPDVNSCRLAEEAIQLFNIARLQVDFQNARIVIPKIHLITVPIIDRQESPQVRSKTREIGPSQDEQAPRALPKGVDDPLKELRVYLHQIGSYFPHVALGPAAIKRYGSLGAEIVNFCGNTRLIASVEDRVQECRAQAENTAEFLDRNFFDLDGGACHVHSADPRFCAGLMNGVPLDLAALMHLPSVITGLAPPTSPMMTVGQPAVITPP